MTICDVHGRAGCSNITKETVILLLSEFDFDISVITCISIN